MLVVHDLKTPEFYAKGNISSVFTLGNNLILYTSDVNAIIKCIDETFPDADYTMQKIPKSTAIFNS